MRKTLFTGLIFLLGISLILIFGCEEKTTTPTTEGTPDEDEFEMMSELNGFGLDALKIAMDLSDSVMAMGGAAKPLFKAHKINEEILNYYNLVYSYDNYWHIFGISAKLTVVENGQTDSMIVAGVDSLRFRNDGVLVRYPDEVNTDEMDVRQHLDMYAYGADGGILMINDHAEANIAAESLQGDIIILNGDVDDTVEVYMEESEPQLILCEMDMTANQTYDDLVIDETAECPTSGAAAISATVNMSCEGEDGSFTVESSWDAVFTFNGNEVTTVVESGGQRWESTGPCGESY